MDNNLKKNRGQFFTTKNRVLDALVSLIKNEGTILEPSAGEGHIVKCIEEKLIRDVFCVELDEEKVSNKICNSTIKVDNFFNYIKNSKKFNTVIGNPPFVKLKNVEEETINLLPEKIPGNGNLYYFFIKYCVSLLENGGELIFIVPKEWLFNVSSKFVRDYLQNSGNFTHFIDCGEEKLFDDADVPALCIFRYEKGYNGKVKYFETLDKFYSNEFEQKTTFYSNTIVFTNNNHGDKKISDYFDVKVGLVTGAEKVFKVERDVNFPQEYLIDIVGTNRNLSKYLFLDDFSEFEILPQNIKDFLLKNKKKLIGRKIKQFDENNWWFYGALRNVTTMNSERKRIYGLMKTRGNDIFWIGNEFEYFGGGLVGLFVKDDVTVDLNDVVKHLNSKEFKLIMEESNMCSNNKVSITPSVLSNLPFPFLTS
jgi:adenine-specific DNA-methyltransferase